MAAGVEATKELMKFIREALMLEQSDQANVVVKHGLVHFPIRSTVVHDVIRRDGTAFLDFLTSARIRLLFGSTTLGWRTDKDREHQEKEAAASKGRSDTGRGGAGRSLMDDLFGSWVDNVPSFFSSSFFTLFSPLINLFLSV